MRALRSRSGVAPSESVSGANMVSGARTTPATGSLSQPRQRSVHREPSPSKEGRADWWSDRYGILLLVALYTAQGLPMGLIFGSIPFLLKETAGYDELALFSFTTMPYAAKLFIAPVVDSVYNKSIGRRKSWIVPALSIAGIIMFCLADSFDAWVRAGSVRVLTPVCILIVTLTAMQDVAVDGWSLEILQKRNVAFASTCQSLGTSVGYLSTFTIFLSLNSKEFCDMHIRRYIPALRIGSGPLLSLAGVVRLVGVGFLAVSFLAFLTKESEIDDEHLDKAESSYDIKPTGSIVDQEASQHLVRSSERAAHEAQCTHGLTNVRKSYRVLFRIIRLPAVRQLIVVMLLAKLGFSAHDNVTALRMIDLGFPKQTIASIAMLQAPVLLIGTIITGRWAAHGSPVTMYLVGYAMRFLISISGPQLVRVFATMNGHVSPLFYSVVASFSILYSIASDCLMFVSIGAFFLKITASSSDIGGSYLTLLYAAQNMGGMWHRSIVLWLVEHLSTRPPCELNVHIQTLSHCPITNDAYPVLAFIFSMITFLVGIYIYPAMLRLEKLPPNAWRPVTA